MKIFLKMIKLVALSVLIIITQYSCDYIIERNYSKYSSNSQTRIDVYKREAKLLLKASKNNLDILQLCETIKKADVQNSISHLTTRLEQTHFEISQDYDLLAKNKLISIPKYARYGNNILETTDINYRSFIENKLKLILNKTETQIQLLDALDNVTDNVDFRILVIKDTQKLKSNIDKIEITLNRLKQQSEGLGARKLLL